MNHLSICFLIMDRLVLRRKRFVSLLPIHYSSDKKRKIRMIIVENLVIHVKNRIFRLTRNDKGLIIMNER